MKLRSAFGLKYVLTQPVRRKVFTGNLKGITPLLALFGLSCWSSTLSAGNYHRYELFIEGDRLGYLERCEKNTKDTREVETYTYFEIDGWFKDKIVIEFPEALKCFG